MRDLAEGKPVLFGIRWPQRLRDDRTVRANANVEQSSFQQCNGRGIHAVTESTVRSRGSTCKSARRRPKRVAANSLARPDPAQRRFHDPRDQDDD
jgi:hypothetical protein